MTDPDQQRTDGETPGKSRRYLRSGVVALVVVAVLFGLSLLFSHTVVRSVGAVFAVGTPGTVSRLLVDVVGLQVLGFGSAVGLFLLTRESEWRSYLRVGKVSTWTVFYGTAVGLALMIVVALATGIFALLDVGPVETAAGRATDPLFYLALFVVSTFVAVPMEEVFFRGVIQRYLEDQFRTGVAIGVASLLFVFIHTGPTVSSGGDAVVFGMFFAFGVVLGVSYHRTKNLFVPIIGHVCFNGVQILRRALEISI
ncbi:MAG: type II CAAX endopeptidase family protein [Halovenus sp.]